MAELRAATRSYQACAVVPAHEVDNLSMAFSMVASAGGLALLPSYANALLPPALVSRPLRGEAPTIDLAIGYNKANTSPLLKQFLARTNDIRVQR